MSNPLLLNPQIYGELELYSGMINQSCWTLRQISLLEIDEINELRNTVETELKRLERNMDKLEFLYSVIREVNGAEKSTEKSTY